MEHDREQILRSARFAVGAKLGEGGTGAVYEAQDRERNARVALKALRRLNPEEVLRFKGEFRKLQDLHHPNLVSLGELVEEQGRWFFTMELVQGVDFLRYVRSRPGSSRPFHEERLRGALRQLALGLQALHRVGKVHRDIKPSNILVTEQGRVVLLDFGILADGEGDEAWEEEGSITGSAAYVSPEQVQGAAPSPSTDWYSVGVLLYQALTGRLPFTGRLHEMLAAKARQVPAPPESHLAGLPEDLCRLCMELLHTEPAQRPHGEQVLRLLGVEQESREEAWGTLSLPFVGRQAELSVLHRALEDSRRGDSVAVRVEGESGVGKSRLVRRFLEEVTEAWPDAVVLAGRCYERESVPYKAVDGLIDALARYLTWRGQAEAEAVVGKGEDRSALAHLFPVLRRVEAVEAGAHQPVLAQPLLLRVAAFSALRELLGRLAARHPVVLVVDDLHWADEDSVALLDEVLRAPGLLLVGTVRLASEATGQGLELVTSQLWQQARALTLEGLPLPEARSLVERLVTRSQQTPATEVQRIVQESGGHPLFIEALVRHVYGRERQGPPSSLDEALWARACMLEPPARRLLELLSVAGGPLPHAVAAHATALDVTEYSRATASLRSARLVVTTGPAATDTLEVLHGRVRQALAPRLSELERRSWHMRLASSLEALGLGEPEVLAHHWKEVGQVERAAEHYLRAAQQATQALAFSRAARLYRLALEVAPGKEADRRRLQVAMGEALANSGRGPEAAAAFLSAAEGLPPQEGRLLRRRAGEQYLLCGYLDEGLALLRQVLAELGVRYPETQGALLASVLWQRLRVELRPLRFHLREAHQVPAAMLERLELFGSLALCLSAVDPIRAADFNARYLLLALEAGERRHLCRALASELMLQCLMRPHAQARHARLEQVLQGLMAQLKDDPATLGFVHANLTQKACLLGQQELARPLLEQAFALLQRSRSAHWEMNMVWMAATWALHWLGEVAELRRRMELPLAEARQRGDVLGMAALQLGTGGLPWLAVDDPQGARAMADETISRWTRNGYHVQHLQHVFCHVYTDLYEGQGHQAVQRLDEASPRMKRARLMDAPMLRTMVLELHARACLMAAARGGSQSEPLLRRVEADMRGLERLDMPLPTALAELLRAGVACARRRAEAPELYSHAIGLLEQRGMVLHVAAARHRLGELVGGCEGQALREQAREWMHRRGVVRPERMAGVYVPDTRPEEQQ